MYIGYNIQKANTAMNDVNEAYKDVTNSVKNYWQDIQIVLRREWVGYDELDFEKLLIKRLDELLRSTKDLTQNTINVLYELAVAWAKFQDSNVIGSQPLGEASKIIGGLSVPSVSMPMPLPFPTIEFDSSTNFGLTSVSSNSIIHGTLDDFVTNVKLKADNLFKRIDTDSAFFGAEQTKKIGTLKRRVGDAVGVITTSLKDFDEAMWKLTNKSYSAADQSVSEEIKTTYTELQKNLNSSLEDTRWK